MTQNNDSASAIWDEDHYGFNDNNGGQHFQVTLPLATTPVPTASGPLGVLYSILDSASASQLAFKNKDSTFQLTGNASLSGNVYTIITPWGFILEFGTGQAITAGISNNVGVGFTSFIGVVATVNVSGFFSPVSALINSPTQFTAYTQVSVAQTIKYIAWGV
jgi:hypothetical protein